MSDISFNVELIAPERRVFSGACWRVTFPGVEGEIGAMIGHAPVATALRSGVTVIETDEGIHRFFASGGFVEVTPNRCVILVQAPVDLAAIDSAALAEQIRVAELSATVDTKHEPDKQETLTRLYALRDAVAAI